MKKVKILSAILMSGLMALALGACGEKECAHTYGEWKTAVQVTCTTDGSLERFCEKCGHAEITKVPAAGHSFGDWTDGDGVRERHCAVCGYTETIAQEGSQGGNQGNQGNQGTVAPVAAQYGSLDMYLGDCEKSGFSIYYRGTSTRVEAKIGEGTETPSNYTFYIPEYVSYIKFIGREQGDPFYNTVFRVETRTSDLEVEFENISIETDGTIFISETRNIDLTLTMSGAKCSFLNTSKAARGSDGAKSNIGEGKIESGGNGSKGSPAFIVNGHCTVVCRASQLAIKGGAGGDGGNGTWSAWPGQYSGNGGNGGDGGSAFQAENTVEVYVKNGSNASILGGDGGNGGSAGESTALVNKKTGSNGFHGANGATGCGTFKKLYD